MRLSRRTLKIKSAAEKSCLLALGPDRIVLLKRSGSPPILYGTANPTSAIISDECARHGTPKAITATAHKLARIIYHLIKNQKAFDDTVFAEQEKTHQNRLKKRLANQAKSLGLQLVQA